MATTDLGAMKEYTRSRNYSAQRGCRLSLRRAGTELAIIIPNATAAQAGLAIGGHARVLFNQSKLAIMPARPDGAFRMRKLQSGANSYPHLLVPIGAGKPFNCEFGRAGSIACEHQVNDDGLVLLLPDDIRLTANS